MGNNDPKWTQEQREIVARWRLDDDLKPLRIFERFEQTYGAQMPMNTINSIISDERRRRAENKPAAERLQAVLTDCLDMLETAAQAEKTGEECSIDIDRVGRIAKVALDIDKGTRNQPTPTPDKPVSPLDKLNRSDKPITWDQSEEQGEVSGSLSSSRAA